MMNALTKMEIERGVPIPPRGVTGPRAKYPFRDMAVGDSFAVPRGDDPRKTAVRISTAWAGFVGRRGNVGRKFSVRTLPNEIRCWRVA